MLLFSSPNPSSLSSLLLNLIMNFYFQVLYISVLDCLILFIFRFQLYTEFVFSFICPFFVILLHHICNNDLRSLSTNSNIWIIWGVSPLVCFVFWFISHSSDSEVLIILYCMSYILYIRIIEIKNDLFFSSHRRLSLPLLARHGEEADYSKTAVELSWSRFQLYWPFYLSFCPCLIWPPSAFDWEPSSVLSSLISYNCIL